MINEKIGIFHGAKIDAKEFNAHGMFDYFEKFMQYLCRIKGEQPPTEDEVMEEYDYWCNCDNILIPEYMDFIFVGNFEAYTTENSEDCCVRLDNTSIIEIEKIQFISFLKEQGIAVEVGTFFIKYSY